MATLAADSAAICAANGVLLREPLNPMFPAVAQDRTFPWVSVIVTIVLLKDDLMCADASLNMLSFAPFGSDATPNRSSHPALPPLLLLSPYSNRLLGALTVPGVSPRSLAAHRQAPAVPKASVAADLDQPLDIHGLFPAQIAFHLVIAIYYLAELGDLFFGEVSYSRFRINSGFSQYFSAPWSHRDRKYK